MCDTLYYVQFEHVSVYCTQITQTQSGRHMQATFISPRALKSCGFNVAMTAFNLLAFTHLPLGSLDPPVSPPFGLSPLRPLSISQIDGPPSPVP